MTWVHWHIGWLNGWLFLIPYLFIMTIQPLLYPHGKDVLKRMMIHPRDSKRDEIIGAVTQILYLITLLLLVFVPIARGVPLWIGLALFVSSMVMYTSANHYFAITPMDQPVTGGAYRISRNPLHFFSFTALLGASIAVGSWLLILLNLISMIGLHTSTLSEERWCLKKYGDSYRLYMKQVPRYFFFF